MDYQCVIVYTVITILPSRSQAEARDKNSSVAAGAQRRCCWAWTYDTGRYWDEDDEDDGCFSWIKRWIKRAVAAYLRALNLSSNNAVSIPGHFTPRHTLRG
uniref:Uncharacterized protein n=1 Tax=Cacopsylla melanoneura TaxID=428564 RepID=A0A8D8WTG8_9HEMI